MIGADGDRALTPELVADSGSPNFVDAGDAVAPVPEAGVANACPLMQKRCNGACVSKNDPKYGCGSNDCGTCSLPHTDQTKCIDGACASATCKLGFTACGPETEGCTTDLIAPNTCGGCKRSCTMAQFCNPGGQCNDSCNAGLTACGQSCVDTETSAQHCGLAGDPTACAHVCPAGANSDPDCVGGVCGFACRPGFGHCTDNTTCVAQTLFYRDMDNDAWGDVTLSKFACNAGEAGAGWVPRAGDCHDGNVNVFPMQTKYFAQPYQRANGSLSYDYDCNGVEGEQSGIVHFAPCKNDCVGSGFAPAGSGRAGAGVNDYCGSVQVLECMKMDLVIESTPNLHFSGVRPQVEPIGQICGTVTKQMAPNPCR